MNLRNIILIGILLVNNNVEAQVQINYGITETSLSTSSTGAVTGTVYNLPTTYAAIITWSVVADGSALSATLEGSLDNSTYFTLDTQTTATGGIKNFGFTAVKYVRISQVSRTGGTTTTGTLIVSRGFINSQGISSLSGLNLTGPLLTSDGTAGAPSFSFSSSPTTGIYLTFANQIGISNAGVEGIIFANAANGGIRLGNVYPLGWSSTTDPFNGANDTVLSRGGAAGKVTLTGTTPMFQLGGTTASFPALKRVGTAISSRLADDSGDAQLNASVFSTNGTGSFQLSGRDYIFAAAPTISSGFGTTPSISGSNGTVAFEITVGSGGVASSGVIGLPTAINGWNCFATDITTETATAFVTKQTASSTTTATLTNYTTAGVTGAWTAGDKLRVSCSAY